MEDWRSVQLAIVDLLGELDGVETVLDYEPAIKSFQELEPYLTTGGSKDSLNVWTVLRTGFRTERGGEAVGVPLGFKRDTDIYTIEGFVAYTGQDSMIAFNNTLERIRTQFAKHISLGSAEKGWLSGPITGGEIRKANFLGVICHHCSLQLPVQLDVNAEYE